MANKRQKKSGCLQETVNELWELHHELMSFGFLLRWINPETDGCDNLYGLGLSLERLGRQASKHAELVENSQTIRAPSTGLQEPRS